MQYKEFDNEVSKIIIYREDNKQTEIISKGDQNKLLVVVDFVGILLIYEINIKEDGKEMILHSGYTDWMSFEVGR